jgi:hypothetical protein
LERKEVALGLIAALLFSLTAQVSGFEFQVVTTTPELVDVKGAQLTDVSVGSSVLIQSTLTNLQTKTQLYTFIVQVKDGDGFTILLTWKTGTLHENDSIEANQSWTPDAIGEYTIEVFVWQSIDEPIALSPVRTIVLTVQESRGEMQVETEPPAKEEAKPIKVKVRDNKGKEIDVVIEVDEKIDVGKIIVDADENRLTGLERSEDGKKVVGKTRHFLVGEIMVTITIDTDKEQPEIRIIAVDGRGTIRKDETYTSSNDEVSRLIEWIKKLDIPLIEK